MKEKLLIYDKSVSGRKGYTLPKSEKSDTDILSAIPSKFRRASDARLPEVSEGEAMRHFVALSVKNHHIDKGFYPLGSCTMKYNPKLNDVAASIPGVRNHHPLSPDHTSQGMMRIYKEVADCLCEVSGFPSISLQPVAGAHGEFAGLLVMRAYHLSKGAERKAVIIPDSAHGTNPASVSSLGWNTIEVKSNSDGVIEPEAIAAAMDDSVAGVMMTNPNTLGIFETHIKQIADIVHDRGGLMYMDGANLNANMGIFRPGDVGFDMMHFNLHKTFSTPHGGGGPGAGALGVTAELDKFLPAPVVVSAADGSLYFEYDRPHSIGRLHSFYGNFGNIVRAWAYIKTLGGSGLRAVSENAVINANYLKALLKDDFDVPYSSRCMHEFVLSGSKQKQKGVRTLDMSKRMLDFGVHSPTNYFPLIVPEALMIEPTETESRETLENFAEVMKQISREVDSSPDVVLNAPHTTPVRRLDEVRAARTMDVACIE